MDTLYFGVDIGGTATKLGVFTEDGTLLDKWEIPTDSSEQGSHILPAVSAEITRYVAGDLHRVAGVGVGVPGPVLRNGTVSRCVNLNWSCFNPARELSALLHGVPVFAGNDANVAAMGEYWQGSGQKAHSLVLVTLGTGVGSGIILDGKIVYGAHGLGGEVGHTLANPDEPLPCNCGHYGCLDQTASATGIARHATRLLAADEPPSTLRSLETVTARDVFDAAKAGDAVALKAVELCMGFLGRSLSMLTCVIDPELFIIGGGVSKAGPFLIDTLKRHYDAEATLTDTKADIVLATLGNDAGIYGAAKLAIDGAG